MTMALIQTYRRSTFCAHGSCVEVAQQVDGSVAMRDSKNPLVPPLSFTPAEWDDFVRGSKLGAFDMPQPRVPNAS